MQPELIERSFTHHPPKGDQEACYGIMREKARELAKLIAANGLAENHRPL